MNMTDAEEEYGGEVPTVFKMDHQALMHRMAEHGWTKNARKALLETEILPSEMYNRYRWM